MLTYNFPDNLDKPLYEYLYECIKNDILKGNLKANEKLPSKRNLAKQLKLSLITIESAYNQLNVEGYIYSLEKKGYYVEDIRDISIQNTKESVEYELLKTSHKQQSSFPYNIWNKLSRKVLNDYGDENIPFNGDINLRIAICKHLKQFHNLQAKPDNIIIGAGSEYLYSLLSNYFGRDKIVAIENPGHLSIKKIYEVNNMETLSIPLDSDGINMKILNKSKANIVHISPAHHFPSGITTPLKRRLELINWAKKTGGYIIEDDYDSEFRYNSLPIPPLYQLDSFDHIIYMNTFTFSLSSHIRIAYMILPDSLIADFVNKLGFFHNTVSSYDQKVLSLFIFEGHFERHINKMRKKYKAIHDELLFKISPLIKKYYLNIIEADSGLHFLIEHHFSVTDKKLEEKIKSMKLKLHTLSHYYHSDIDTKKIIISYHHIDNIDLFIKSLDNLFNSLF